MVDLNSYGVGVGKRVVCKERSLPIGLSSVSLKHKINSERLREAQNKHYNVHI